MMQEQLEQLSTVARRLAEATKAMEDLVRAANADEYIKRAKGVVFDGTKNSEREGKEVSSLSDIDRVLSQPVPDNTHLYYSDMAHPPFNVDDIAVGDLVRVRGETLYFWVVSVTKRGIFARGVADGGICHALGMPKTDVTDYFHPDPRSEARWISRPTKFND